MDRGILTGKGVILAVLVLLAAGSLGWGCRNALLSSADLMRRAEEVDLVLRGLDPYQDPDMTYPPSAPVVFVPLVGPWLHSPWALKCFWLTLNLASLAYLCWGSLFLWGEGWSPFWRWLYVLTIAASKPVRLAIGMGQFAIVPLTLLIGATVALRKRREWRAGVLTGLALAKPTMALPFLGFLLARGRFRAIVAAVVFQLACWLSLALWVNVSPVVLGREWVHLARTQAGAGLVDLPSLLARFGPEAERFATLASLSFLIAGCTILLIFRRLPDLPLLSLTCLIAALFSYHRPYDLVLLAPVFALIVDQCSRRPFGGSRLPIAIAAMLAILMIAPSHPAIVPEWLYNSVFAIGVYLVLAWNVVSLGRWDAGGFDRADQASPTIAQADVSKIDPSQG